MHQPRGFTLIEAVVAIALCALLAGIALPRYQGVLLKARRAEAIAALDAVEQAQERWRTDHVAYADASAWHQLGVAAIAANRITSSGLYVIDIESASASGYAATASARSSQVNDTPCRLLRVTLTSSGTAIHSSVDGAGRESSGTPNRCWGR